MRRLQITLAILLVTSIAFSACSSQDTGGTTAGSGGAPDCQSVWVGYHPDAGLDTVEGRCMACERQMCCAEVAQCGLFPECVQCVLATPSDPRCTDIDPVKHALASKLGWCSWNNCIDVCWPH